jgi:hypothetical protein
MYRAELIILFALAGGASCGRFLYDEKVPLGLIDAGGGDAGDTGPPPGCAPIVNGSFEVTSPLGFLTDYTYAPGNCAPEGNFDLVLNGSDCHSAWSAAGFQGRFMAVNGAPNSSMAVWSESLQLVPSTTYFWRLSAIDLYTVDDAMLEFSVNGTPQSTFTISNANWQQLVIQFQAGTSPDSALAIYDLNTGAGGNDFGLDEFTVCPF